MLRDIREQSSASAREAALRQSRERLRKLEQISLANQMATGIAHEINQPLATIGTYVRIAREQLAQADPDIAALSSLLDKMDQQTRHAAQVVRSLRGLIGKSPETHEAVDINTLIEQTIELAQQEISSFNVAFSYRLAPDLPAVDVIYIQIQQVLLNLIHNSRDALSAHFEPRIEIESRRADKDFVELLVRDNGDGISHELAGQIFSPFFSTRDESKNMGVGLSICQSIVENHGGLLRLNPHYRPGAEFSMTLPVVVHFD